VIDTENVTVSEVVIFRRHDDLPVEGFSRRAFDRAIGNYEDRLPIRSYRAIQLVWRFDKREIGGVAFRPTLNRTQPYDGACFS